MSKNYTLMDRLEKAHDGHMATTGQNKSIFGDAKTEIERLLQIEAAVYRLTVMPMSENNTGYYCNPKSVEQDIRERREAGALLLKAVS